MPSHILLVEDNALLRRSLTFNLEKAGYRLTATATAEAALEAAERDRPHIVLLDINLPGMDGLDALPHFRKDLNLPVIFITGRRRELDEILGLEMGADDYISKPINEDVLLARIKAVLRRTQLAAKQPQPESFQIGDLVIDLAGHVVTLAGNAVSLSPREFDLLHALARNADKVVSIDELLAQVWGTDYAGQPQVVYVHIRWLREKIEVDPNQPQRIVTIRGVGYKLIRNRVNDPHA